jgi:hypothetical protein
MLGRGGGAGLVVAINELMPDKVTTVITVTFKRADLIIIAVPLLAVLLQ